MEIEGAVKIFLRRKDKNKLRWTQFVGDGDRSCFQNVAEAVRNGNQYENAKVESEEHVHKHMGSALYGFKRKTKGDQLKNGKVVGGPSPSFYGLAIKKNSCDLEGWKNQSKLFSIMSSKMTVLCKFSINFSQKGKTHGTNIEAMHLIKLFVITVFSWKSWNPYFRSSSMIAFCSVASSD